MDGRGTGRNVARDVLRPARCRILAVVSPEPVPLELRRVLGRKLALDDWSIDAILALLKEVAKVSEQVEAIGGDPDDDRILAAAIVGAPEILISGDRQHPLPLGRHRSTPVVKPQAFVAEIAP